jgi:KEOPS complex subunit Cgi121
MDEIRLLFGRPLVDERREFISRLKGLQKRTGCTIQAIDADNVACEDHLIFAARKALLAFSERRNIAKDLGVETLRYASGERQIERALAIGISPSTKRIALIIIRSDNQAQTWPDDIELFRLIEVDCKGCSFRLEAIKETFNISDEELNAAGLDRIPDLVQERVALVDTIR